MRILGSIVEPPAAGLAIRDTKAAQAALAAAGIEITEGPVTFPGGSVSIFVRDPDRNVVEMNQAAN